MTMRMAPISAVAEVNPPMPKGMSGDLARRVNFVPMAGLSEDGRIQANGDRQLSEVIRGYTYFENGDVIIAKITPCLENGKAAYVTTLQHGVAFGSTEFHVLR